MNRKNCKKNQETGKKFWTKKKEIIKTRKINNEEEMKDMDTKQIGISVDARFGYKVLCLPISYRASFQIRL